MTYNAMLCNTIQYTTVHHTTLHYTTLQHNTLQYTTLHHTTCISIQNTYGIDSYTTTLLLHYMYSRGRPMQMVMVPHHATRVIEWYLQLVHE
jgi:hypothetical protein